MMSGWLCFLGGFACGFYAGFVVLIAVIVVKGHAPAAVKDEQ